MRDSPQQNEGDQINQQILGTQTQTDMEVHPQHIAEGLKSNEQYQDYPHEDILFGSSKRLAGLTGESRRRHVPLPRQNVAALKQPRTVLYLPPCRQTP